LAGGQGGKIRHGRTVGGVTLQDGDLAGHGLRMKAMGEAPLSSASKASVTFPSCVVTFSNPARATSNFLRTPLPSSPTSKRRCKLSWSEQKLNKARSIGTTLQLKTLFMHDCYRTTSPEPLAIKLKRPFYGRDTLGDEFPSVTGQAYPLGIFTVADQSTE
ncbi:hypothetical protein, partial [Pseudomonas veronii]|uniref:hypothetical protein n=1 Tax=Pseudomonas veronii TaxID=76761 RepID=UPI001E42214E